MERLYTLINFHIKLTPIENSVRFTYLAENSKSNILAKEKDGLSQPDTFVSVYRRDRECQRH
ncbi:hypothetical protein [Coleofasciculus sp. G2-EDA-02]|uniref:hypothetical protein n=1 Tax=Coleofasciculus sp. G2-EDA-02 TaxID=3069529 RepID=UPI0032FF5660